tara:strand:+ start:837 stop:1481 length:645 start_codon:yes stop_codon:yes gene_type:complete
MIDSTLITDPYIYVEDNCLSEVRCKEIIDKFNNDRHVAGVTGLGVDLSVKDSKDMHLSYAEQDWSEEDKLFAEIIGTGHNNYYRHLNKESNFTYFTKPEEKLIFGPHHDKDLELFDTGYQIQRTEPGKGYVWHDDFDLKSGSLRYLTFILYLNAVEEGWTQFYNGNQVSPKAGRLVFFPATWTYVHQGYPPKQTKYLMTGWMHTKTKTDNNGET